MWDNCPRKENGEEEKGKNLEKENDYQIETEKKDKENSWGKSIWTGMGR